VTAVGGAVSAKDADRRAQVIGKLEQITAIKPDEVAESAKTIFNQRVVRGNIIQGEHVTVTIGTHDEKATKKLLGKWQAWGVIIGGILTGVLTLFALQQMEKVNTELSHVKADREKLATSYQQLTKINEDLIKISKNQRDIKSRRVISFQLLVLKDQFIRDKEENRRPVLEILGTNATGPIHQGRELIREILKFMNKHGEHGKVRILLLDPTCDVMRERMQSENDQVGRIRAETNVSLYLLADIRTQVGESLFSNLELRMYKEVANRSLLLFDAGATMVQENADVESVIKQYPDGVILENPYPNKPGERGLEGESNISRPIRGEDETRYNENLAYFRNLWRNAQSVPLPSSAFHFPPEFPHLAGR
jgi:hypothetical protein